MNLEQVARRAKVSTATRVEAFTTLHIPRDQIGYIICNGLIPAPGEAPPTEHEIV